MNKKKYIRQVVRVTLQKLATVVGIVTINIHCCAQAQDTALGSKFFFESVETIQLPSIFKNPSDSLISEIMNRAPALRQFIDVGSYYETVLKEDTYYLDLNGDDKWDMVMFIDGYWNGNGIEIFLDHDGELRKVYSKPIFFLSKIFKPVTSQSVFYLSSVQYHYSVWPYLASYDEVTILIDQVVQNETYFFEGTQFPTKNTLYKPFVVTQDKYNLRKTPKIDNSKNIQGFEGAIGNIILELAPGDEGVALAETSDETGRIWWFVQVKNNINKSLEKYYYIDAKGENHIQINGDSLVVNKPMFGWVSSKYVVEKGS